MPYEISINFSSDWAHQYLRRCHIWFCLLSPLPIAVGTELSWYTGHTVYHLTRNCTQVFISTQHFLPAVLLSLPPRMHLACVRLSEQLLSTDLIILMRLVDFSPPANISLLYSFGWFVSWMIFPISLDFPCFLAEMYTNWVQILHYQEHTSKIHLHMLTSNWSIWAGSEIDACWW